jgi:tetratricopeptide (TPR) repeat protein
MLGVIAFNKHEYVRAEALFTAAAASGHVDSEICLGELYSPVEIGDTGLQNPGRAFEIFQRILQNHPQHPFALYGMAKLYLNGVGVTRDVATAQRLYQQALEIQPRVPVIEYQGRDLKEWSLSDHGWAQVLVPAAVLLVFGGIVCFRILRRRTVT